VRTVGCEYPVVAGLCPHRDYAEKANRSRIIC
jgi:hypothetical protein